MKPTPKSKSEVLHEIVRSLQLCTHCKTCEGIHPEIESPVHPPSLELTPACNEKCVFCYSNILTTPMKPGYYCKKNDGKKAPESITVSQYGEPLLAGAEELARQLAILQQKFPKARIDLQTNGTLLTKEAVKLLKPYIGLVMVSINAGNRRTHKKICGKDNFDKLLEGLRACKEFSPKNVRIGRFVSCPGINDSEVELVARLLQKEGFDELMLHQCVIYPKIKTALVNAGLDFERNESIAELLLTAGRAKKAAPKVKVTIQGCVLSKVRDMPAEFLPGLCRTNTAEMPKMRRTLSSRSR